MKKHRGWKNFVGVLLQTGKELSFDVAAHTGVKEF